MMKNENNETKNNMKNQIDDSTKLYDLPDSIVDSMGNELYELAKSAGYDTGLRVTINNLGWWNMTVGQFKAEMNH